MGSKRTEWCHDGIATHGDPRPRPLPSRWRHLYGKRQADQNRAFAAELSEEENIGLIRFYNNFVINYVGNLYPRMCPDALGARGVDI